MMSRCRWRTGEPELHEILHDDVLQALMRRDGVSRQDLDTLIGVVQRRMRRATPAGAMRAAANDDRRPPA